MKNICAIGVFMLAGTSAWAGVVDDFEGYEVGSMPGGDWQDATDYIENSTIQSPSAGVIDTTDAFGNATRAVQIHENGIGTSGGIALRVEHTDIQRFETDIRIDQVGNGNYPNWTYAAGLFQETDQNDLIRMPQALVYSLNNSRGFRLYIHNADGNGGLTRDISLGSAQYEPGSWYRIAMEVDTTSGDFITTVTDIATGEEVVSHNLSIANWNSDFGQYDLISINDGEYGSNPGTIGNMTTIDNVSYVPAPGAGLVLLCGGIFGTSRRRR